MAEVAGNMPAVGVPAVGVAEAGKTSKKTLLVAVGTVVALVVGSVGGFLGYSTYVKSEYQQARVEYEKSVKEWNDVTERRRILAPECGELAEKTECSELVKVSKDADTVEKSLDVNIKRVDSPSRKDVTKLEQATKKIDTECAKVEPVLTKVEKSAENKVGGTFASVLEEANTKAGEAANLADSLAGKVKDEKILDEVKKSGEELTVECAKWKDKATPTGHEAIQAYLTLKRLINTVTDTSSKANESHTMWQQEKKKKDAENYAAWWEAVRLAIGATPDEGGLGVMGKGNVDCIMKELYPVLSEEHKNNPPNFTPLHGDGSRPEDRIWGSPIEEWFSPNETQYLPVWIWQNYSQDLDLDNLSVCTYMC